MLNTEKATLVQIAFHSQVSRHSGRDREGEKVIFGPNKNPHKNFLRRNFVIHSDQSWKKIKPDEKHQNMTASKLGPRATWESKFYSPHNYYVRIDRPSIRGS